MDIEFLKMFNIGVWVVILFEMVVFFSELSVTVTTYYLYKTSQLICANWIQ